MQYNLHLWIAGVAIIKLGRRLQVSATLVQLLLVHLLAVCNE